MKRAVAVKQHEMAEKKLRSRSSASSKLGARLIAPDRSALISV
jgi:hypothetical protein